MLMPRLPKSVLTVLLCFASVSVCRVHAGEGDHSHEHDRENDDRFLTTRSSLQVLPLTKQDDVFHFVIYGDRTGGVPAGLKVLEQAVKDTNLLDPDLVMTVGDLIQGYNDTPEWVAGNERVQRHHGPTGDALVSGRG